jgi:hypothetical protein
VTGASLRQLDYWSRLGLFEGGARAGGGSGTQRDWDDVAVVLLRALVLFSQIWGVPRYRRLVGLESRMQQWALGHNGSFASCWLVVRHDGWELVPSWARNTATAAVVIDLGECQLYTEEARNQLEPYLRAATG